MIQPSIADSSTSTSNRCHSEDGYFVPADRDDRDREREKHDKDGDDHLARRAVEGDPQHGLEHEHGAGLVAAGAVTKERGRDDAEHRRDDLGHLRKTSPPDAGSKCLDKRTAPARTVIGRRIRVRMIARSPS